MFSTFYSTWLIAIRWPNRTHVLINNIFVIFLYLKDLLIFILCVWVVSLHVFMCTTCVPKNDVGSPGMRVKDSSKAPCGATNQIQAHGKNSKCSWLPSHLSSTQFSILIPHIFRKTMPLMTLSEPLRCCCFNQNFLNVPTRPPLSSSFLVKGSRNDQNTTKSNDLYSESKVFYYENKFLCKKHN